MLEPVARTAKSLVAVAGFLACAAAFSQSIPTRLEFLGEALLPPGLQVEGRSVGGLSGIAYEPGSGRYYVVSDEPGNRFPASFFVLEIDLEADRLKEDSIRVTDVVTLQDEPGQAFEVNGVDPEGAAFTADGNLLVSSEGQAAAGVPPFLREFGLDGHPGRTYVLPDRYLPRPGRGVRHNLAFEALTVTPDHRVAIVATENALTQDGSKSTLETRSPSRLARFDTRTAALIDEYLYWVEPVASPATIVGGLEVAGVVELIALDASHLLSLERSFSVGAGNVIRLYLVSLEEATDISDLDSLGEVDLDSLRPAAKQLLVDFSDLGVNLDNLEGMCFGPQLSDGRRALILIGDDNFNYPAQVSQILAFAVSTEATGISQIQGPGHASPFEGQWVVEISGVVTAMQEGRETGFWMQASESPESSTSSLAIQVLTHRTREVEVGDRVEVSGRVVEKDNRYGLTVTVIEASSVGVVEADVDLPPPVRIGEGGRWPPDTVVDNDGLEWYEPGYDGIDFWESLESMRIEIGPAVVVGPTTRRGNLVVVAGSGPLVSERTSIGGLLLRPGDDNPERLTVDTHRLEEFPSAAVGDRLEGSLAGILDYRFGAFRLLATEAEAHLVRRPQTLPGTLPISAEAPLTIATYNVENLAPSDGAERFQRLAEGIVEHLGGPDILALQEVQDNSGVEDDGVVAADETFEGLIAAILEVGGPAYEYAQIDPEDGADGGQPGGNIRVGYLFNPLRVVLRNRGSEASSRRATTVKRGEPGVQLAVSPGLVQPDHRAFRGDKGRGFEPGRKSLAAEFDFSGQTLFVLNSHLKSKRGDDPLFGPRQPPLRITEDQRSQQTTVIGELAAEILELDPAARLILLGDLNDHEFRSPLRALEGADLVNLMHTVPVVERYSFNYRGNSQLLDHVFVSRSLHQEARPEVEIVHINADLPFDQRVSDHDPVLLRLHLD